MEHGLEYVMSETFVVLAAHKGHRYHSGLSRAKRQTGIYCLMTVRSRHVMKENMIMNHEVFLFQMVTINESRIAEARNTPRKTERKAGADSITV